MIEMHNIYPCIEDKKILIELLHTQLHYSTFKSVPKP